MAFAEMKNYPTILCSEVNRMKNCGFITKFITKENRRMNKYDVAIAKADAADLGGFKEITIEALKEKQERDNPKPLTLDELRERDGKPVYCVDGSGNKCWCIVNAKDNWCVDVETGAWDMNFYAMSGNEGIYGLDKHLGWLAFDHPPKEDKL